MRHVYRRTFKPNKYSKQTFNSKQSELEKHFLRSNLKRTNVRVATAGVEPLIPTAN